MRDFAFAVFGVLIGLVLALFISRELESSNSSDKDNSNSNLVITTEYAFDCSIVLPERYTIHKNHLNEYVVSDNNIFLMDYVGDNWGKGEIHLASSIVEAHVFKDTCELKEYAMKHDSVWRKAQEDWKRFKTFKPIK